jgi:hypothetical protein
MRISIQVRELNVHITQTEARILDPEAPSDSSE